MLSMRSAIIKWSSSLLYIQRLIIFTLSLFELGGCADMSIISIWAIWASITTILVPPPWHHAFIYFGQGHLLAQDMYNDTQTSLFMTIHDHHVQTFNWVQPHWDQRPESILEPYYLTI